MDSGVAEMTATVFERLKVSQPTVLAALEQARLEQIVPVGEGEAVDWEALMQHDAHRRVRGAIRQVRWGS